MATENNNKSLNVPNLRFPEFSGEWEHVALSEIAARVTRKNKDNASKLPLTISAQYGLVDQISFFNKVVASADMSNYYLLKQGEFAYNKSYSSDYPWGAIKRLDRYPQGALSSLYICFAVNNKVVSDFAVHYFESSKWHREVSNIAGEGARNHGLLNIAVGDFFDTKHRLPGSKEEQKKIAALLNLITERIATQIKIIEDLKKLKSAISNEIFEHTSNRKCELKEIASVIMGQSPSSHAYNHKAVGLPLIQGNLDIENGQLSPRIYTHEITQTCECGDVILTVRAPVGEIAIAQQEACIGRGVCSIRPHVKNDTNLIYQFLQYFKPKWGSLEQGSTFTAVSGTDIRGIAVSMPSADKIELLNVYDNKIKVESRILTNLIQQKQHLLAQMFI